MQNSRGKRRRNHRVHIEDDGTTYAYNPTELLYGIGSGRIRSESGENAERVAATIVLGGMRESSMGALLGALSVDELIESAKNLVAIGVLAPNGIGAAPDFN